MERKKGSFDPHQFAKFWNTFLVGPDMAEELGQNQGSPNSFVSSYTPIIEHPKPTPYIEDTPQRHSFVENILPESQVAAR